MYIKIVIRHPFYAHQNDKKLKRALTRDVGKKIPTYLLVDIKCDFEINPRSLMSLRWQSRRSSIPHKQQLHSYPPASPTENSLIWDCSGFHLRRFRNRMEQKA